VRDRAIQTDSFLCTDFARHPGFQSLLIPGFDLRPQIHWNEIKRGAADQIFARAAPNKRTAAALT
jgi:hypothetical protein